MSDRRSPVFIDHTGRRWRRIRRAALAFGVATTVIALFLVGSIILNPPVPPELPLATANNQPIARPTTGKPGPYTRVDRLRTAYRRKLAAIVRKNPHIEAVLSTKVCIGGRVSPCTPAARNQSRQPCRPMSETSGSAARPAGT